MEKNIISTEAKIEEVMKNKAIVTYTVGEETKKVVAHVKNKKVGDVVALYKAPKFKTWQNLLLVLMPLFLFLCGFGFGFFFKNDLYHYILAASLAIFGFAVAAIIKLVVNKYAKQAYYCE